MFVVEYLPENDANLRAEESYHDVPSDTQVIDFGESLLSATKEASRRSRNRFGWARVIEVTEPDKYGMRDYVRSKLFEDGRAAPGWDAE